MDPWLDPSDPAVIKAITGSVDGDPAQAEAALRVASDILTPLTGYRVHPAGYTTQSYVFRDSPALRLTPAYRPLAYLISVNAVDDNCDTLTDVTSSFCVFAGAVRPVNRTTRGIHIDNMTSSCLAHSRLLMAYSFGSTVGPGAKRAVLEYAHQIWLMDNPGAGECMLPERVTSLNREGLSYTFVDPMQFLDQGRTGIPSVDIWLVAINPSKAKVPSGVFIPEAPPGVVR